LEASKMYVEKETDWLSSRWTGFKGPLQISRIRPTGNEMDFAQDTNPSRNGSSQF
jgi:2-oxoglutarate dehydrogenase E1 component